MEAKTFEEIREIYIKTYPHLENIKCGAWQKGFCRAALSLRAPKDVSIQDTFLLAKMAYDDKRA